MNTEVKPYLIVLYGKNDCALCARLREEVEMVLKDEAFRRDFDLDYQNLSTAEGMVAYAKSETVNGQRIPAIQIMKFNHAGGAYRKIPDTRPERRDEGNGELVVPVYLQLETEYGSPQPEITGERIRELMGLAVTGA